MEDHASFIEATSSRWICSAMRTNVRRRPEGKDVELENETPLSFHKAKCLNFDEFCGLLRLSQGLPI